MDANKNMEGAGVLFPSRYRLLFAAAEKLARVYSRCSNSTHQALFRWPNRERREKSGTRG